MVKYTQGTYKLINKSKYKGNASLIIYRSSWELSYLFRLDTDPNVIQFSSEEIVIPYQDANGKVRRYFVDFFYTKIIDGKEKSFLVEIKPYKETIPPILTEGKKTKTKIREILTWDTNQRKWRAARKYCEKKGWEFQILTEYELGLKKR